MSPALRLALVATVVVAVLPALVAHRPPPVRVAAVVAAVRSRPGRGPPRSPPRGGLASVGGHGGLRWHVAVAVAVGAAAGALAVVLVAGPLAAVLLPAAVPGAARVRARRAARRAEAAVAADVPEVADLLVVAAGAGLTVPLAVDVVARRGTGPLALHLAHAAADAAAGRRLVDVLDELPSRAGEPARPLAAALLACLRDGAPAGPTLTALAAEARDHERRRVEAAARRVPVLLLFPLVLCVLPAFALLTVAPLVADAFTALRL